MLGPSAGDEDDVGVERGDGVLEPADPTAQVDVRDARRRAARSEIGQVMAAPEHADP
jgi:hypothetical protein